MNSKHTLLAAVLALALSGCGISHGDRLNYGNVNAIQRNVTTEAQIRAMFGEPVSVQINQKLGVKKLVYAYRNDDSIKKGAAGIGGAILGGVLGHQIGGGSGQAIATSVGAAAGGLLGDRASGIANAGSGNLARHRPCQRLQLHRAKRAHAELGHQRWRCSLIKSPLRIAVAKSSPSGRIFYGRVLRT